MVRLVWIIWSKTQNLFIFNSFSQGNLARLLVISLLGLLIINEFVKEECQAAPAPEPKKCCDDHGYGYGHDDCCCKKKKLKLFNKKCCDCHDSYEKDDYGYGHGYYGGHDSYGYGGPKEISVYAPSATYYAEVPKAVLKPMYSGKVKYDDGYGGGYGGYGGGHGGGYGGGHDGGYGGGHGGGYGEGYGKKEGGYGGGKGGY